MGRFWKFAQYLIIPMVGAASPLLAIPAIAGSYGAEGWATVAIGQGVGGVGAVFVELAWGLTGPQLIARTTSRERLRVFVLANACKGLIFLSVAPLCFATSYLIDSFEPITCGLAAVSVAATGMSPGWYFLGTGEPGKILICETIPRVLLVLASSVAIMLGGWLTLNPISALVSALVALTLSLHFIKRPAYAWRRISFSEVFATIRGQLGGLAARGVSAVYISLPIPIVGIVNPGIVPEFSAIDRVLRLMLVVLQAVPNSFQQWIGVRPNDSRLGRQIWLVVALNSIIGLAVGVSFSLAGPWIVSVLFRNTIQASYMACAIGGLIVASVCASRATGGLGLVRLNLISNLMISAVVGACVGVVGLLAISPYLGVVGALVAELFAEVAVLLFQCFALVRCQKREVASRRMEHV